MNLRHHIKSIPNYISEWRQGKFIILKGDPYLWVIYFVFVIVSIIEVYSASSMKAYAGGNISRPILTHIAIIFISTLGAIFFSHWRWEKIKWLIPIYYVVAVLALIAAKIFGVEANDAQRAIIIGGISIQPSEILKPAIVLVAAYFFGGHHKIPPRIAFYVYLFLVLLPTAFVFTESGSTAIIILLIAGLICFVSNASPKDFWRVVALGAGVGVLLVTLIMLLPSSALGDFGRATTWKSRLSGNRVGVSDSIYQQMTDAERDSLYYIIDGANYQRKHAQIAISRGALSPLGVLPGNSLARDFLPEAHNDFIYAIIIEEWGPIGAIAIPAFYLIFFFRLGSWAKKTRNKQQRIILMGMGLLYVIQALLNMGVASGLFPLMGQTLPLISKGGSSFLFTALSYGIVLAITTAIQKKREEIKARALEQTSPIDALQENNHLGDNQ